MSEPSLREGLLADLIERTQRGDFRTHNRAGPSSLSPSRWPGTIFAPLARMSGKALDSLASEASVPDELPRNLVDCESNDVTGLLADLQTARTHLNRAIDRMPGLTIGDQSRRHIEAQVAVLKVRLMQLLDEL